MAKNVIGIKRSVFSLLLAVAWALAVPSARADVFARQMDGSTQTWGAQYSFPQSLSLPNTIFVATEFGATQAQASVTLYNGMQINLDGVRYQTSCDYLGDPIAASCIPVHYDQYLGSSVSLIFSPPVGTPTVVVSRYDNVIGTYSNMSAFNFSGGTGWFMYGDAVSQTKFCMADTAENAYDCILGIQRPTISLLQQYQSDGKIIIPDGGSATGAVVNFGGIVQSSSINPLRLQIELQPAGTSFSGSGYTGAGNISSALVHPGTSVMLSVPQPLPSGQYHWQASVVDSEGLQSQWQFPSTPPVGTDFSVSNPQNLPPYVYAAQLDGSTKLWSSSFYFPTPITLPNTVYVATEIGTANNGDQVWLWDGSQINLDGIRHQTTCDYLGDPQATTCVPVHYVYEGGGSYSLIFVPTPGIPSVVVSQYDSVAGTYSSMSAYTFRGGPGNWFMYGNFLSQTKLCVADTAEDAYICMLSLGTGATATTVSSSLNPSTYESPFTLESQIIPRTGSYIPTGTVTFSDSGTIVGTAALSGGVATLPISTFPAGLNPITASYSGDANYAPSASPVFNQQVNQATSTVVLVASANPSYVNQPVSFTATVAGQYGGTPTGFVTFQEGKTALSTVQLVSSQATLSYTFSAKGKFNITAVYSGDLNYKSSISNRLVETAKPGLLPIGLPVLFVPGICEQPPAFQVAENRILPFLQGAYPRLYGDPTQYWVFYDGQNVSFEEPNGSATKNTVPATSRFFSVAFDDPGQSLVQNFDPVKVANVSIYAKADELAHIIWIIKSITGVPRVLVVAHSMGGVVSRAYAETLGNGTSLDPYFQDISTLVTLDTPHGGSLLAELSLLSSDSCTAQQSVDKTEMQPGGQDSIIPKLNYFSPGASPLPPALRIYSIISYWTIDNPLDLIDPLNFHTDNVLYRYEQDLYSNLNNPSQNSRSSLFKINNPFGSVFGSCGIDLPYVLHSLDCTGSADQTMLLLEKEIKAPAVMMPAVELSLSTASVALGGSVQLMATTRSGAPAIWSILEGSSGGSITVNGLYTTGSSPGKVHVVAIDSVKSNDYGIATITVTP